MKLEYKPQQNLGPGPGEYDIDFDRLYNGPQYMIGTGQRSDLGVGKAYLAPGPGQYNIRGKHDGKKIGFGKQKNCTKTKKTYDPGPGSYNLPGTVGNIPKYLLIANKAAAQRVKNMKRFRSGRQNSHQSSF